MCLGFLNPEQVQRRLRLEPCYSQHPRTLPFGSDQTLGGCGGGAVPIKGPGIRDICEGARMAGICFVPVNAQQVKGGR